MLEVFYVHRVNKEPIAELYYDTDSKTFELKLLPTATFGNVTGFIHHMLLNNRNSVDGELALAFVKERLVPPNRAGIAETLSNLNLPYYDEYLLLRAMKGRCVMDDFLVTHSFEM